MTYLIICDPSGLSCLRLIEKGIAPTDITVYEDTYKGYNMCKKRGVNVTTDLNELTGMKFDVIVGNPPYQSEKNQEKRSIYVSLWPRFWKLAFDLINPGGKISLVTPDTWCGMGGQLRGEYKIDGETRLWNVFNKYTSVARVRGLSKHFRGVGSSFSVVTVDTSGSDGLSFADEDFDISLGFYPRSGVEEVKRQLSSENNIGSRYRVTRGIEDSLRVSFPMTRKLTDESVEVIQAGGEPQYDIKPSLCGFVYCDTVEEAETIRRRILECDEVLYRHCRYNGFLETTVLKQISLESPS